MRRLHERGEAQARSARPRVLVAADWEVFRWSRERTEAARGPTEDCVVAATSSAGLHQ